MRQESATKCRKAGRLAGGSAPAIDRRLEPWRQRIADWGLQWGVPGLEARLTLEVSTRMYRSLGRCAPHTGTVRIAAFLLEGAPDLIEEVVCHEAAHAAAFELYGPGTKPHGREWRALMHRVGHPARLRVPLPPEIEAKLARRRSLWRHSCAVCRASHVARRPVYQWRCASCLRNGHSGELTVERLEAAGPA